MSGVWRDLRHAVRSARRQPLLTAVIVGTLALGIGANTAMFSAFDGVVLRPLPYPASDRLVIAWQTDPPRGALELPASYPTIDAWRTQSDSFEQVASFVPQSHTLAGETFPEQVDGARVSAEFFEALRVRAAMGRLFSAEDDETGAANVAVVSHGFWARRLGGDQSAVGRPITLDGTSFSVVGVLPEGFEFPLAAMALDVWTPTALDVPPKQRPDMQMANAICRLKPDVTIERAEADLRTVFDRLREQYPRLYETAGVQVQGMHEALVGDTRGPLRILLAAVSFVLLIACANVAGVLMTGAAQRRREFAVRSAVGAGRWRLVRQVLVECGLLALVGGVLGVLLAHVGGRVLLALAPDDIPRVDEIGLNARVLAFAVLVTGVTSVLCGLPPALRAGRAGIHDLLKSAGGFRIVAGRYRFRGGLVVIELALACTLLIGAMLTVRSLSALGKIDPGLETENLLTFFIGTGAGDPAGCEERSILYEDIRSRVEALPGVERVVAGTSLPLAPGGITLGVAVVGRPRPAADQWHAARHCAVTTDYFRGLGIPLVRGRTFTAEDRRGAPGVVLINEALARQCFPDEDPIGLQLHSVMPVCEDQPATHEIIGIVGDVRENLVEDPRPCTYVPSRQQTWPFMTFAVRTSVPAGTLADVIRREVAEITPDEAVSGFGLMGERFDGWLARDRFLAVLLSIFAFSALILALIGTYGLAAGHVAQRTNEIGLRMALGATPHRIRRGILVRVLILASVGIVIGLGGSLAVSRVLESVLFGVHPLDPLTLITVSVSLPAVALAACSVPAFRATRVDPMAALRCE